MKQKRTELKHRVLTGEKAAELGDKLEHFPQKSF
jgi:hypothetical protein